MERATESIREPRLAPHWFRLSPEMSAAGIAAPGFFCPERRPPCRFFFFVLSPASRTGTEAGAADRRLLLPPHPFPGPVRRPWRLFQDLVDPQTRAGARPTSFAKRRFLGARSE